MDPERQNRTRLLEQDLDAVPFGSATGLGSSLADVFNRIEAGNPHRAWREPVVLLAFLARSAAARTQPVLPGEKLMVTCCTNEQRIRELMLPIVHELSSHGVVVVGTEVGVTEHLPAGQRFDLIPALGLAPVPLDRRTRWLRDVVVAAPRWVRALARSGRRGEIGFGDALAVLRTLVVQSRRTRWAEGYLRATKPAVLVTEFDRGMKSAPLVIAARAQGVRTITLVHGTVNPRTYLPPLADHVLVWNDVQARLFAASGDCEVSVVGYHRISTSTRRELRRATTSLLFASSGPEPGDVKRRIAVDVVEAARAAGWTSTIRLHPLDPGGLYDDLSTEAPYVVQRPGEVAVVSAIEASDVVVSTRSTIGSEALMLGVPAITFAPSDPDGRDPSLDKDAARGPEELVAALRGLAAGPEGAGPVTSPDETVTGAEALAATVAVVLEAAGGPRRI
jgi:hypothetical protein